jgi:hypothetical protein
MLHQMATVMHNTPGAHWMGPVTTRQGIGDCDHVQSQNMATAFAAPHAFAKVSDNINDT